MKLQKIMAAVFPHQEAVLDTNADHGLAHGLAHGLPERLGLLATAAGTSTCVLIHQFSTCDALI